MRAGRAGVAKAAIDRNNAKRSKIEMEHREAAQARQERIKNRKLVTAEEYQQVGNRMAKYLQRPESATSGKSQDASVA